MNGFAVADRDFHERYKSKVICPFVVNLVGSARFPTDAAAGGRSSSLLKNLEMENFHISADRFWSGAVELDVIS
ncbi:hypothetical protein, partial [Bradyrhizobium sp. LB11.1]|uniref:hypothetical protein n=1 Tax=Bradyrhizobium sp. LB11.1 TaxID=3156326 RepID=UPI0033908DC4